MDTENISYWKGLVWKIAAVVGVIFAIYLIALAITQFKSIESAGRNNMPPSTITVNGKAERSVKPDIAVFSYSVSEEGKTVEEAQNKATTKANKALDAIKAQGVDTEKDLTTTSYNIEPVYTTSFTPCFDAPGRTAGCGTSQQVLKGYRVSQTSEVKIRDLAKAGKLFETVGTLGVQNVFGLNFSVDNVDDVKAEIRSEAIADAQAKAKTLARDLGVELERINYFYEEQPYPIYAEYARSASVGKGGDMMQQNAAPEISSGEQKIVSSVTITYEIE